MANYYMTSDNVPELQQTMGAYYTANQQGAFTGAQAVPHASMHPVVAERLGIDLSRPLRAEELANLLNAKQADGSEIEGRRPIKNGYIDFVFSAPKSYSIAAVYASPKERELLEAAYLRSVDFVMDMIAKEIGTASVGDTAGNKARNREPAEIAMIPIQHWTARPTVQVALDGDTKSYEVAVAGDMQRHTHILTLNHAFVPGSGRVTSLYQAGLEQKMHEWGALGQAYLGTELRKLGVNWELDSTPGLSMNERMGRLTDIPRWMCDLHSKRHKDGLGAARQYAKDNGFDYDSLSPEGKADLLQPGVLKTRKAKANLNEYESWMKQGRDAGYKHRSVLRPGAEQALQPANERYKEAYAIALPFIEEQLERRAVLEGSVPRVAAAKGLIETGIASADEVNTITAAMRSEGVRQDGRTTSLHWAFDPTRRYARISTQLSVSMEEEAIGLLRGAAADKSAVAPMDIIERAIAKVVSDAAAKGQVLDFSSPSGRDQLAFGTKLAQSGMAATGVGWAGTGKSVSLRIPIEAGKMMGREHIGVAVAWRQTEGLKDAGVARHGSKPQRQWTAVNREALNDAGIDSVYALTPFIKRVQEGKIKIGPKTTVVIDEVGLVGTKQLLELARLREKHGFQLIKIGDDAQCQPVEAGASVDLCRRAYGTENVPELSYNIRQTQRDAETSKLWREGNAAEALARKDADGTLKIVPGGYAEAVKATVDLWSEQIKANSGQPKYSLGISVPTNADGRAIGEEILSRRMASGAVRHKDFLRLACSDQNGETYELTVGPGSKVRLFDRVSGKDATGRVSIAGVNGTVVEIIGADRSGMDVRKPSGKTTRVAWDDLRKDGGPIRLTYGDAVSIDARQSDTVTDHITSMPGGSAGVNGFKAYTTDSRHRRTGWIVTSQGAEKQEIQQRLPLGDPFSKETDIAKVKDAVIANMARNLSRQPKKTLAVDFMERAVGLRSGTIAAGMAQWQKAVEAKAGNTSAPTDRRESWRKPEETNSMATFLMQRQNDKAIAAGVAEVAEDVVVEKDVGIDQADKDIQTMAAIIVSGEASFSEALDFLTERWEAKNPWPSKEEWEKAAADSMIRQKDEWVWTSSDPAELWGQRKQEAEERIFQRLDEIVDRLDTERETAMQNEKKKDLPTVAQQERDAARAIAPTPAINNNLRQAQDMEQARIRNEGMER